MNTKADDSLIPEGLKAFCRCVHSGGYALLALKILWGLSGLYEPLRSVILFFMGAN